MGAKHTPGRGRNWTASTGPTGYGAHDGVTVTDNRGLVVAVAIGDVPELDAPATARLIASAPDLLEALKGAIGALEFFQDFHRDLGNEDQAFAADRLDAARAAIARATGEAA
jgi:hypothetical protein